MRADPPSPEDSARTVLRRGLKIPPPLRASLARWGDTRQPAPFATPELEEEFATLRQIVAGLDRLETQLDRGEILPKVARRGYLTPDEEERVRRMLLAYRNLRLAAYEIILRHGEYPRLQPETHQYHAFVLAFTAAIALYAKSLRVIQLVEHSPPLRNKLNEPEPRADLEAGFFDDVLAGYSSLGNYRLVREADRFWRANRRRMAQLGLAKAPLTAWALDLIRRQRRVVRHRLLSVLFQRLRRDWRQFRTTVFSPAHQARYGLQAVVGETFAQARTTLHYVPGITNTVLDTLTRELQPGDVLLVRTEKKVTTALLPGFWAHAAIYLGRADQLTALRLPDQAKSRLAANESFGYVLEGVAPRVEINPLRQCLWADHVLALRPNLPDDLRWDAVREALTHYGKPYDFEFDFTLSTRVVCTGLVYRALHGRGAIRFELTKRLGRFTLSGDDLAHQALDAWNAAANSNSAPFRWVALALHRRQGGVQFVSPHHIPTLLGRLRKGWRPLQPRRRRG